MRPTNSQKLATSDGHDRNMEQAKLVGPKAGSLKYDILTALTVFGLHGTPTEQTSMIRLCAMITARYNWRLDEVTIGQEELARLWKVNNRTVKREMKRLMGCGALLCLRPGVRGRVGAYRLNMPRIYSMTRHVWPEIGSDFEARLSEIAGERTVVRVNFSPEPDTADTGTWGAARRKLRQLDPGAYESWFAKLAQERCDERALVLRAPNSFVARYIEVHLAKQLAEAVRSEMPTAGGSERRIELIT